MKLFYTNMSGLNLQPSTVKGCALLLRYSPLFSYLALQSRNGFLWNVSPVMHWASSPQIQKTKQINKKPPLLNPSFRGWRQQGKASIFLPHPEKGPEKLFLTIKVGEKNLCFASLWKRRTIPFHETLELDSLQSLAILNPWRCLSST